MKIVAISGSLRKESFNTAVLNTLHELVPEGIEIEVVTLNNIPFFNEDTEKQGNPEAVATLRKKVMKADGLVIASPEYNNTYSGALKNALEWLSRRVEGQAMPLAGKPTTLLGASPGGFGTARAQHQLKQLLTVLQTKLYVPYPGVHISTAHEKISDGKLVDENNRIYITTLLEGFVKTF